MRTITIVTNQKIVDFHNATFHVRHEQSYTVYPFVWVKHGKEYVGYCSLTKKVYDVTRSHLTVLGVNDFIIEKDECEERERCLNILCDYNKTTARSFAKANNMKPKCLEGKWTRLVAYWSQFNLSDILVEFKLVGE